ncbi:MAG: hypothetical protein WC222_05640 [Parachlamydiales bacterium]|jgi:hypothetical protein
MDLHPDLKDGNYHSVYSFSDVYPFSELAGVVNENNRKLQDELDEIFSVVGKLTIEITP